MSKIGDNELISVISAAIAAKDARPGYRLVVRSFRRMPQCTPVWGTTGRMKLVDKSLKS